MSASEAVVIGVFTLVLVLMIAAVVTRLRRRAVRPAINAEDWASFQRRIEQVRRQRAETPEDRNQREVPEFRPARLEDDLCPGRGSSGRWRRTARGGGGVMRTTTTGSECSPVGNCGRNGRAAV